MSIQYFTRYALVFMVIVSLVPSRLGASVGMTSGNKGEKPLENRHLSENEDSDEDNKASGNEDDKDKEDRGISEQEKVFLWNTILIVIALSVGTMSVRQLRKLNDMLPVAKNIIDSVKQGKLIDTDSAVRIRAIIRDNWSKMEHEVELVRQASNGKIRHVDRMVKLGAEDFDMALVEAARGGHIRVVERMIELGAEEFDEAMISAAKGGHLKVVRLMIERGAEDFDEAILAAQKGGHDRLAKFLEKYNKY